MKKLFLTMLFFISTFMFSQNERWMKVSYYQLLDNQVTSSTLAFNSKESVYYYGNKTKIDTTSFDMTYIKTDSIGDVLYKNKSKNQTFTRRADGKEVILVSDKFLNLKWKILDESKIIEKFKVKKATINFRGRTYIAWFCEDIPSNNGPLKMGGLPGLILELETLDNYLKIKFLSIESETKRPNNLDIILSKYDRIITEKDYFEETKKETELLIAKIKSKMPREAKVEIHVNEKLEKYID